MSRTKEAVVQRYPPFYILSQLEDDGSVLKTGNMKMYIVRWNNQLFFDKKNQKTTFKLICVI